MALPLEQIDEIAEELRGQCVLSLEDIAERDDLELDAADHAAIDERVFCCTGCSWWCEIDEMSDQVTDEWFCTDCED